jgi:NitT/TauT family transport system substrate-binding protein
MRLPRWMIHVAVVCLLASGAAPARAERLRVGYLHTLAVDGQFWIAMEKGYFAEQGLEIEATQFTSGVPLMQALSGGSLDVAVMGAVISNFPSRGMGKVFLINDIEYDTAMLFARPEAKSASVKDTRGQNIATVKGTTAHVFLHNALRANGMDSNKDVNLVSMDMAGAVTAFISGAVPYVATWAPFHVAIREKLPGAKMLSSAKDFYPQAAIIGGWVASNDYYAKNKETLKKVVRGWIKANDYLIQHSDDALHLIHKKAYSNVPFSDIEASWKAEKAESTKDWVKLYQDGTVAKWIGQVEKVFVEIGSTPNYVEPSQFFDPGIFLSVAK